MSIALIFQNINVSQCQTNSESDLLIYFCILWQCLKRAACQYNNRVDNISPRQYNTKVVKIR